VAQAGCAELQCRVESPDRKEVDKKVNRINCASNNNNGDHNTTDHNLKIMFAAGAPTETN